MGPWTLTLGWERFMALRTSHANDVLRLLRQPQHFLSPDGHRFAPLRLLRELGEDPVFPPPDKDPVTAATLHAHLATQGWRILREGDAGFDTACDAFRAWCRSFGVPNLPHKSRTFTMPPAT